jgi:hypothetical protein
LHLSREIGEKSREIADKSREIAEKSRGILEKSPMGSGESRMTEEK